MNTLFWAILGATIGVVVPFAVLRARQLRQQSPDVRITGSGPVALTRRSTPQKPAASSLSATPVSTNAMENYHAVSITIPKKSCAAVQQYRGRKFLVAQAPALPVSGCGSECCSCRYIHYQDRREEENRRDEFSQYGGFGVQISDNEKRSRTDRREDD